MRFHRNFIKIINLNVNVDLYLPCVVISCVVRASLVIEAVERAEAVDMTKDVIEAVLKDADVKAAEVIEAVDMAIVERGAVV